MPTVQRFEDLRIWQGARTLENKVFQIMQTGPFSRDFELKNQISRPNPSVMDNIAEGFGRGSRTEFIQFMGYLIGSNDEVKSQLYRAIDRDHINQSQFDELYAEADHLTKTMISFRNYLKQTPVKGIKYNTNETQFVVEEP